MCDFVTYNILLQEISLLKKALKTVTDKVRRSELEVLAGKVLY